MIKHNNRLRNEFGELYKSNYARLFYCALDIVNDEEWAKDIVSDVFSKAWDDYERLRAFNMDSYLYTCVRNRSIDYVRRRTTLSGCQKILMEVAKEWHESHHSDYEEEIIHMHKAIEAMPEKQRQIFLKCFLDGKRYKEVAQETGLTEASIHKYMVKSFAFIKEKFKNIKKE